MMNLSPIAELPDLLYPGLMLMWLPTFGPRHVVRVQVLKNRA